MHGLGNGTSGKYHMYWGAFTVSCRKATHGFGNATCGKYHMCGGAFAVWGGKATRGLGNISKWGWRGKATDTHKGRAIRSHTTVATHQAGLVHVGSGNRGKGARVVGVVAVIPAGRPPAK